MPRFKKGSPEAKAWGEQMRAARQKANKAPEEEIEQSKAEAAVANPTIEDLMRQIEELKHSQFFSQPQVAVRAITKYSINPQDYPDPRERIADEPKLESEAFRQNFVMEWQVGKVNYDAKDGVNYTEPKFKIELWRWLRDSENEITNKKFLVKKATFFEDPDAAIQAAVAAGLEVPARLEKTFLDEMRYLRIRDWVFDIFFPKPPSPIRGIREEVIGNRLVPVMEVSSTDPVDIPFSKL